MVHSNPLKPTVRGLLTIVVLLCSASCQRGSQTQLIVHTQMGNPPRLCFPDLPTGSRVDYHWDCRNDSTYTTSFTIHEPQLALLATTHRQQEHLLVIKPGEKITISTKSPLWRIEGSQSTARLWDLQQHLARILATRAQLMASTPAPSDSTLAPTDSDSLQRSLHLQADLLLDSALQLIQSFIWAAPLDKGILIALQAKQSEKQLLLPPEQFYMLYSCIDSLMRTTYTPTPLMDSLQRNIKLYMRHKALENQPLATQGQHLNAFAYCFYRPHTDYPTLRKQHWTYLCIDQHPLPQEQLRLLANQASELNLQILAVDLRPSDPCFLYTCQPDSATLTQDSISRQELLPLLDSLHVASTPFYQLYAPAGQPVGHQIQPTHVTQALRQQFHHTRATTPTLSSSTPQANSAPQQHTITAALDSVR